MELPKPTNHPTLRRPVSSLPTLQHAFPPFLVEPILPTLTPLPPLTYSPSLANLAEQIVFINLCPSSPAVPAPQPAYPPSHPFSAQARLLVASLPPRAVAVNRG
ncbi:hypothetical protein JB92DRAFT_3122884 [Gautieria morchelliformis]|nr:hypothetical protein JB92DRAFT_3122884 [Gautieria morchelliformis]